MSAARPPAAPETAPDTASNAAPDGSSAGCADTDVAIIGAGPAGLFAVFELGLLACRAHVIDALPHVGGQPAVLYPDKPIYDIPAIARCSGQALADALMRQIAPFQPVFHLGHVVDALQRQADGRFVLGTAQGLRLRARAVFIAAGVGAFEPRRLKAEGVQALEGRQVFHPPATSMPPEQAQGRRLVIVGGDDSALAQAVHWASASAAARPASVTLVHRRDSFDADEHTAQAFARLRAAGALRVCIGQVQGVDAPGAQLRALHVMDAQGQVAPLPADAVLVHQGLSPRLGPIAGWGLAMQRKQLLVDTEKFQTSEPGIFAVGDVNTYPGKKKLILCGFHEATLAAYAAQALVAPDKPVPFQYTTSSTRLHALLCPPGDASA